MPDWIEIDGSQGEGGGQMLRSALSLSLLTGQSFRMRRIRAGRPKPGLAAQHLASVLAAAEVGQARVSGARLGSGEIEFVPGRIRSDAYHFRIGTAGATVLVLQTIFLPLLLRGDKESRLRITGGTHVRSAPCFEYLRRLWQPALRTLGADFDLNLVRPGFFPKGDGLLEVTIRPTRELRATDFSSAAQTAVGTVRIQGHAFVAGLDATIARRLEQQAVSRLKEHFSLVDMERQVWPKGPGAGISLFLETVPHVTRAGFTALGERGKPAEAVADVAVDDLLAHWRADPLAFDLHAADQMLLPLVFAHGQSRFRVGQVTQHLLTNAEVIQLFSSRSVRVGGRLGEPGVVEVAGDGSVSTPTRGGD